MGSRPLPLLTGRDDLFSLSEEIETDGEGDIEGPAFKVRRAARGRLGPGDASSRSSQKGEGDSENFVDLAIVVQTVRRSTR